MHPTNLHQFGQAIIPLCQDMQALCKPLNHLGIDYLSYTRVYNNGERFFLTTSPKIIEDYIDNKKYLYTSNEVKPKYFPKHKIIVWSTLPHQEIFQEAKSMGASNGIYIFNERNDQYYDSFGFGTSQYNESIINMYFNKLEMLKTLVTTFSQDAASTLKVAEHNKILLPFNNIKLDPYILSKTDYIKHNTFLSQLTKRERDCIMLLVQGLTAKEIAKELKLSFRTVELYLHNLKIKMKCKNKSELIMKIAQLL